jgi:hypothetical protein
MLLVLVAVPVPVPVPVPVEGIEVAGVVVLKYLEELDDGTDVPMGSTTSVEP